MMDENESNSLFIASGGALVQEYSKAFASQNSKAQFLLWSSRSRNSLGHFFCLDVIRSDEHTKMGLSGFK